MANVTTTQDAISLTQYWYDTNYVGVAGFTVLVWDHIDTFVTEVELVWMRDKSLATWLFLLIRYLIPLGFVVNISAYVRTWTYESCKRFIRSEGAGVMIGLSLVEVMMFFRIRALYHSNKWVWYGVGLLFAAQTAVNGWLLTKGGPVPHWGDSANPIIKGCTMIFKANGAIASASAWLPLLYDTVIFVLTVIRVLPVTGPHIVSELNKRLFEDGILYYSAIFVVSLASTILIPTAPVGLKNIGGQLQLLISVTMMSRITLSLKREGAGGFNGSIGSVRSMLRFARSKVRQGGWSEGSDSQDRTTLSTVHV